MLSGDWGFQAVDHFILSPAFGLVVLWVMAFALRADARRGLEKSGDRPTRPEALVIADRQSPRVRRTFMLIRLELAIAFGIALLTAFLWIASPGYGCMCMYNEPPLLERLIPWVVVIGLIVGLAGVVRYSRIDPEAGERSWRYRDY